MNSGFLGEACGVHAVAAHHVGHTWEVDEQGGNVHEDLAGNDLKPPLGIIVDEMGVV